MRLKILIFILIELTIVNGECGVSDVLTKIVGGQIAEKNEWPWMVYLLIGK